MSSYNLFLPAHYFSVTGIDQRCSATRSSYSFFNFFAQRNFDPFRALIIRHLLLQQFLRLFWKNSTSSTFVGPTDISISKTVRDNPQGREKGITFGTQLENLIRVDFESITTYKRLGIAGKHHLTRTLCCQDFKFTASPRLMLIGIELQRQSARGKKTLVCGRNLTFRTSTSARVTETKLWVAKVGVRLKNDCQE